MKNPHQWLDHSCCLPSPWMSIPKQIFLPQRHSAPSQWLASPLALQYFVLNQLQDHKFPTEIKFQDLGMHAILSRRTLHLFSVTSLTKWHAIIYPLPLNMTGIWTLKFFSTPFEKWNPKGSFFVDTIRKFVWRVQILLASLKKNPTLPIPSKIHNAKVEEEGVVDKTWNVPNNSLTTVTITLFTYN